MLSEEERDSVAPTWTLCFFDCAPSPVKEHQPASPYIGIEREMKIMYQQPHLVPPMKLTVYDDLPATPSLPTPSHLSHWMSQGRNLASRASERASLSIRKRSSSRPIITSPRLLGATSDLTRRRVQYRPLELSIYLPQNRLSDLPEFNDIDFTDDGAIQLPPRALIRARSAELRRTPSQRTPQKSVSMFEEPTFSHQRANTVSSVISTSRPPSEYEALHSHPVSWIDSSLPGLPPQCHHRVPAQSVSVLSPMQEELSPACTPACITIDGTVLELPQADPYPRATSPELAPTTRIVSTTLSKAISPAPFVLGRPPTSSSAHSWPSPPQSQPYSHVSTPSTSSSYSTGTTKTSSSSASRRLSQWLNHTRAPSSSTSSSTIKSFAEHRRKRSEFYQVRIPKQPLPQPQAQTTRIPFQQTFKHQRTRTLSASTVGSTMTVDTDIMSLDGPNDSMTSMSTAVMAPTVHDMRASSMKRGNTARSFSKPIVILQEEDVRDPKIPVPGPEAQQAYAELSIDGYLKEIGGPLRSPEVGVAF